MGRRKGKNLEAGPRLFSLSACRFQPAEPSGHTTHLRAEAYHRTPCGERFGVCPRSGPLLCPPSRSGGCDEWEPVMGRIRRGRKSLLSGQRASGIAMAEVTGSVDRVWARAGPVLGTVQAPPEIGLGHGLVGIRTSPVAARFLHLVFLFCLNPSALVSVACNQTLG